MVLKTRLSKLLVLISSALLLLGGLPFAQAVTVTLPIACNPVSGPLVDTLTLSGGGITPTTLLCNGNVVNFTVTASATVTLTVGSCFSFMCFFFASGSSYATTTTIAACSSGTCAVSAVSEYEFGQGDNQVSLGACPTKDTATVTLTNGTMYLYSMTSGPGVTTIGGLQAEVASVTSAVTAQTLQFGVYVTDNPGLPSATNPLRLLPVSNFADSLAAGTKNTLVVSSFSQVNFNHVLGGYTFAIGLTGTSKIVINASGMGGMTSVNILSTNAGSILPVLLFSLGSSSTALFFCAQSTYSSQTVTATVSSTVVTTTTSTSTQAGTVTISVSSANPSSPNFWYMPILFGGIVAAIIVTASIGINRREVPGI